MQAPDASPRGQLGDFLSTRRSLITAADVGLPETGHPRRVPGLRREEVAQLAGISIDYYTRLEQGRVRTASRPVLHAIGRALLLNDDQQRHLIQLAHPDDAVERRGGPTARVSPQVERLLANLADTPALVMGRYFDILAWNRLAAALLGDLAAMEPRHRNYVRMTFLDPHVRAMLVDWRERAQEAVSALRLAAGVACDAPRLRELVGELSLRDQDFRTWWTQHLVTTRTSGSSRLDHPVAGRFSVDWQVLTCVDDGAQAIVLMSAPAGGPDHAAIRTLDAWAERQGLAHGATSLPSA
ncbi:helix-turn-helix transcriptional regulator [Nonomuraea sp. 3-1Str]|uniref:helix-turn-helix transcriptional regulator n=1 Tax=Nonomuraea sp. 3-1Str TaxID=2929801 RepID=UPI00285AFDA8|nr:helix-turn-helix transcriptional regulator [Nonomuraea sp. 3-1Str]MDR8408421.1 helix-turn-helix transcriptional regulator [Nonomuraea sp. 3-1Str]